MQHEEEKRIIANRRVEMKEQKKNEQEFDFIKEKIKDKPINKRRLLIRAGYHILCAIVFGAVACFVFVFLHPHVEAWLYPKKNTTITIPKDEALEEEPENPEASVPTPPEESQTVYVPEELEVDDYQELQKKMYAIGKQANKSVVTVTGVTSGTDWFNTPYEKSNQASGIIIGNNGQELLILTEKKVITDAQVINITFIDNKIVPATLKKYDGNTGIAILSVPLTSILGETMEKVAVAPLGNSLVLSQGTLVIAVGSPQGANYSILCGTITSSQNKVTTIDNNYTIFTTDMVGSEAGSGVLVNLFGEIVGLVIKDYSNESDRNTITALSISELKQVIEELSNNQDIPYLGLRISTVTDVIANQYGLPRGVYIKSVEMDSPAMSVGLQEADIIVKMNGETVTSVEQYNQILLEGKPGETINMTVKRQGAEEYVDLEYTVAVGVLQ